MSMRLAILHDHLRFIGGGERVALLLANALDADVYVTDRNPDLARKAGLPEARVTEIGRVPRMPLWRQSRQKALFEGARIPGYDGYILSGNWAVFAAARHRPNLWYCYTPVRVFYDLREPFLAGLSPWSRWAARRWIARVRPEYEAVATSVDRIVVLSRNVQDRVRRYLGREAEIAYPPVDVSRYRFHRVGDFWLSVNRLSHEKRLGLQVDAFRRLPDERLVVVGGPQMGVDAQRLVRSLDPPPNVTFVGEVDEPRLLELYATCRGLIATSIEEDFGLTPVEAMASGKAVVAVDEGGYRESIVPGETGWLVPPAAADLAEAIQGIDPDRLTSMRAACRERAEAFDVSRFVARMRGFIEEGGPRPKGVP